MKFNNLSKTFIVVFLSLTSIFCACGKKEEGNVKVETKSITEITASSAKSGGNVTVKNGITVEACGICWDENSNPTINDCFTNDSQQEGEYVSTMENLKAETKYYVRAYANTSSGVMYGDEKSFTTTANGGGNGGNGGNGGDTNDSFSVTTDGVTEVTSSSAKCGGVVTINGNATVTARGVCWSISQNPTIAQAHTNDGQGAGAFTSSLTGLSANTTYYVKAYAQSGSDIVYGSEMSFTTDNAQPAITVTLTNVSPTFIELKFEPSSNISYYCYNIGGTLTSTTHQTGIKTIKYERIIINTNHYMLQPDTEYEFTVAAYDANGTVLETIHPKFKTSPAPYSNYYRIYLST